MTYPEILVFYFIKHEKSQIEKSENRVKWD